MIFELLELEYKDPHNDREDSWLESEEMKNTEKVSSVYESQIEDFTFEQKVLIWHTKK